MLQEEVVRDEVICEDVLLCGANAKASFSLTLLQHGAVNAGKSMLSMEDGGVRSSDGNVTATSAAASVAW